MKAVGSVFAQASFQFCGHLDEYLIKRVDDLALFYMQTRFGKGGHCLKIYKSGKLVEERWFSSHRSILGYYFLWVWHWCWQLWRFSRKRKNVKAIFFHPLGAFGMRFRRRVKHIFWQWDYFPSSFVVDRMFNKIAKYYADRCASYRPITGAIGRVMGFPNAQVLMLGVEKPRFYGNETSKRLLLVGQLRHGQGVEQVLEFIRDNREYSLSLIGAATYDFGEVIKSIIGNGDMAKRVYFPNRFFTDAELREEAKKCFAVLALYDTSPDNLTHYADPGKVKSSAELGLPVVMTRISEIVPYVERFHSGVVVDSIADIKAALADISDNYASYRAGVEAFAEHFQYEKYYDERGLLEV
jgi:hypothetical protein